MEIGCFCKDAFYTTKKDKRLFENPTKIPAFIQDRISALVERYHVAAAEDSSYPDLKLISYKHGAEVRSVKKGLYKTSAKVGAVTDSLKRKMTFALVDQNGSYQIDFLYLYIEAIEMQKKRNFNLHFTSRLRDGDRSVTESAFLKRYGKLDGDWQKGDRVRSLLAQAESEVFENHGLNQYHSAEFSHHICVHFSIFLNKVLREYLGISSYKVVNQVSPLGMLYHEGSGHCESKERPHAVLQSGDELAGEREIAQKMNTALPKGLPLGNFETVEDFEQNGEEDDGKTEVPVFIRRKAQSPRRQNRFEDTTVDMKVRDPALSPVNRRPEKVAPKKLKKEQISAPKKAEKAGQKKDVPAQPKVSKVDLSLLKYKKPTYNVANYQKRKVVGAKLTDSITLAHKRLDKPKTAPERLEEPEELEKPEELTPVQLTPIKALNLRQKEIIQTEDQEPEDNLLEDEPEEDIIVNSLPMNLNPQKQVETYEDFEQNNEEDDNDEPPVIIQKRAAQPVKKEDQPPIQVLKDLGTSSQHLTGTVTEPEIESHPLLTASEHKFGKLLLTEEEETTFLTRLRVVLKDAQRSINDILSDYEAILKSSIFIDAQEGRTTFFKSGQEEIDIYLLDHPGNRVFYDFNKPTFAQIIEFEEKSKFIFAMIDFIYELNDSGKETRELLGFLEDFSFVVYTDLTVQIKPVERLKELLMLVLAYKPYRQVVAIEAEQFVDQMRAKAKIDYFYSASRKRLIGKLVSWQNTHLLKEEQRLQLVRDSAKEYMKAKGISEGDVLSVNEKDLTKEMCKYPEII